MVPHKYMVSIGPFSTNHDQNQMANADYISGITDRYNSDADRLTE